MANTDVRITQEGDEFVPDISSVPIVAGDTVTFLADPDSDTELCMKTETAAILSPTPALTVSIPAGESTQFTFAAADPGYYCVLTQSPDWPYPDPFSCASDIGRVLAIQPGTPPNYSGPVTDPQT
jgi:hypothetical protein